MNKETKKKGMFNLCLKNINEKADDEKLDFTLKEGLFEIADDQLSGNGQILDLEVLEQMAKSIKDKPILTKYFPVSEDGKNDDHLGTHEEYITKNRDGEKVIDTDTISIGHFTEEGYIEKVGDKNILYAKGVLYNEKYPDIIALLQEWLNNNIQINTSCEYYYQNYKIINGIEYILPDVVFSGHTILNSELRGDYDVVPPAYENSQLLSLNMKKSWNNALTKDLEKIENVKNKINKKIKKNNENVKQNNKESDTMEFFKKVCQLSHDDIRSKIYEQLEKNISAEEYWDSWISEVYDDYFIYCLWNAENKQYDYFKVNYTKDDKEDTVTIDMESKTKVVRDWTEVQNQIKTANNKIEELTTSINSLNSDITEKDTTIKTLNSEVENLKKKDINEESKKQINSLNEKNIILNHEKTEIEKQLNTANEQLKTLSKKVENLSEVEKQYNQEKYEKALNERTEEYKTLFKSMNALDTFESEEVQNLIKESIDDENKIHSLNAIVVKLVPTTVEKISNNKTEEKHIKELNNKKIENLIPKDASFESRYME